MTVSNAATGRRAEGLLGIYLNDHLAGATGGTELARRVAASQRGHRHGAVLERLAAEIREDRAALLDVMAAVDVPASRYKVYGAWMAEKAGRLKPNRRLLSRSPLSTMLEVELLRLGVEGKAAAWRTLRELAGRDPRLDAGRLDRLLSRAQEQRDTLEDLRVQISAEVFGAR